MQRFSQRARQMRFSAVALALAILLGITAEVRAATFTVNTTADNTTASDGFCTLREAIDSANNAGNGDCGADSTVDDTITFSVSGTITLGSQLPDIAAAGKLAIDGAGQSIVISGSGSVRVFQVLIGADLTLKNLTIIKGKSDLGGAIRNNFGATLTIINSTLPENTATGTPGQGGAIANGGGRVTIINSTLSNNSAATDGGAIVHSFGTLTITNSTLWGNSASSGGGIANTDAMTIKNSIVANSSGGNCSNFSTVTAQGFNFATDGTCPGFMQKTSAQLNLGSLANNGGPTQTHALQPGSVAIDAATDCTDTGGGAVTTDQRGVTRPQDGDANGSAICDVGAYEAAGPPVVTSTSLQAFYTNNGPDSFTVTFNEPVQDPSGDSAQDDVTNPANYLLINKGADNIPNTTSCAGGVAGDDSALTVSSVSYDAATFTSTVTLASAPGVGAYRLFVCGTTSIVDLDGTALNGGTDSTFDFVVTSAAPPPISAPLLPTPGALAGLLALLVAIGLRSLRRV